MRSNTWTRSNEEARRAVTFAIEETRESGGGFVTTEHLLVGILKIPNFLAAYILQKLGVTPERFIAELESLIPKNEVANSKDCTLSVEAKRAIDLAYEESTELKDEYIGTEHFLLGLVRESESPASKLLATYGINSAKVRTEVIALRTNLPDERELQTMWQSFSERARAVVYKSLAEAERLGGEFVLPEHLLLAVTAIKGSTALQILESAGVDVNKLSSDIESRIPVGAGRFGGRLTFSRFGWKVIDFAYQEFHICNSRHIGTEHLLLGLIGTRQCVAADVLTEYGIDFDQIQNEVLSLPKREWRPSNNKWQIFTHRARKAVFHSQQEALRLKGGRNITTEHLLLGILSDPNCSAVEVIQKLEVTCQGLKAGLERVMLKDQSASPQDFIFSEECKVAIHMAEEEAKALGDERTGTEHLLLGIIRQVDGPARKLLLRNGIKLESVLNEIALLRPPPNPND